MSQYADISFANSYFETRLHTDAWDDSDIIDRNKALSMATRDIDRLDFAGDKADSEQELEFPRGDDTEVPDDIKIACCEIALALLDGAEPERDYNNANVTSQGYSSMRTTYNRDSVSEHILAKIASVTAWQYLKPYLREERGIQLCRGS